MGQDQLAHYKRRGRVELLGDGGINGSPLNTACSRPTSLRSRAADAQRRTDFHEEKRPAVALGPRQAGGACVTTARGFLALAEETLPDSNFKDDLRRMAVVMSVAAVDTYMHAAVLGSFGPTDGSPPGPHLRALDMSLGDMIDIADSAVRARRAEKNSRPRVQVKNALHRRLLRKTYQSADQVADAMAAAGVTNCWKQLADRLNETSEAARARLNGMVRRRNQIVHEGDLRRLVRPRTLSFNDVSHDEISADVDWIESLLDAFDYVLQQAV